MKLHHTVLTLQIIFMRKISTSTFWPRAFLIFNVKNKVLMKFQQKLREFPSQITLLQRSEREEVQMEN